MTLNDAFEWQSIKATQLMQRGSLLLLVLAATLMLAFGRHNGIVLGVVLALGTVVVPTGCVLARRMREKARQRETEDRLMMHTITYLQNQEPACMAAASARAESEIEILARTIDGGKLPTQDFRKFSGIVKLSQVADPAVFDALPRRYAVRGVYEGRLANLAAGLPQPVPVPLGELLPAQTAPRAIAAR